MENKTNNPKTTKFTNVFLIFTIIMLLMNTVIIYVNHTGGAWISTAVETDLLLLICMFLLMQQVNKLSEGEGDALTGGNAADGQGNAAPSLNRDPLTGIRNKTAYDNEIRRLEGALGNGYKEFFRSNIRLIECA